MTRYPYVKPKSPPTSYAIAALLEGEPGATGAVLQGAATRAAFLVPGLYLSGLRGKQLLKSAAIGSATISGFLILYYMGKRRGTVS